MHVMFISDEREKCRNVEGRDGRWVVGFIAIMTVVRARVWMSDLGVLVSRSTVPTLRNSHAYWSIKSRALRKT